MELNQQVANFTLQTDEDKPASLTDFAGKPVILFFYPKADTPGCTIEACGFRDTFKKLQAAIRPRTKPNSAPSTNCLTHSLLM
jgi:peroxiredoxin Q/BCP